MRYRKMDWCVLPILPTLSPSPKLPFTTAISRYSIGNSQSGIFDNLTRSAIVSAIVSTVISSDWMCIVDRIRYIIAIMFIRFSIVFILLVSTAAMV